MVGVRHAVPRVIIHFEMLIDMDKTNNNSWSYFLRALPARAPTETNMENHV
jgi:hypothetical protein